MRKLKILFVLSSVFVFTKCIEQIPLQENTFEELLVVEAILTNELKKHQVKLSKTFPVDTIINTSERNAVVIIVDEDQNIQDFQEISDGLYESMNEFRAEVGKSYNLEIITADGKYFASSQEKIEGINEIDELVVNPQTLINGTNGLGINVISNETNRDAKYYRYEFDETYRIEVPKWSFFRLEPLNTTPPNFSVQLVQKTIEDRICYNTVSSNEILLFDTTGLSENNVNTEVQFLPEDDFKIAHRYSILVRQYVQSFEAHTFYTTLKRLSSNQSIFTQVQPGFLAGNIAEVNNPDKRALGYFEVNSVSEKRIFFNYEDFFTNNTPVFVDDCVESAPPLFDDRNPFVSPLIQTLQTGLFSFYQMNANPTDDLPGQYLLVRKVCGDCRELGSITRPPFWID